MCYVTTSEDDNHLIATIYYGSKPKRATLHTQWTSLILQAIFMDLDILFARCDSSSTSLIR